MRKLVSNGLIVFAGMVSVPAVVTRVDGPTALYQQDPRLASLREFFGKIDAPVRDLAAVFLEAADAHDLDWRLLPSISMIESTAGKFAPNNNLFGWDEGRAEFESMSDAIRHVARRLAESTLYRNKSLDEVLRTYNPNASYPEKVKSVMRRIGPS